MKTWIDKYVVSGVGGRFLSMRDIKNCLLSTHYLLTM